jgi:hypothetical protein
MQTLYTKTSALRTLKIMLRNLNEIVLYVHEFGFWYETDSTLGLNESKKGVEKSHAVTPLQVNKRENF